MSENRRNYAIIALVAFGLIMLVGLIVGLTSRTGPEIEAPASIPEVTDPTAISSPFSRSEERMLVNYEGSIDENSSAVFTPYRVFGINSMILPGDIQSRLRRILSNELATQVSPTFATSYIQINSETIDCDDEFDCRFSFYVDSPESYYDFRLYYTADGREAYDITQQPIPEVES